MKLKTKLFGILAAAVIGSACGGKDDPWTGHGNLGESCYPNNTCNSGLVCKVDTCVEQDGGIDSGVEDAGLDAKVDAYLDSSVDAEPDTGLDSSLDAEADAVADAEVDAQVCDPPLVLGTLYPTDATEIPQVLTNQHYIPIGADITIGNCVNELNLLMIDDNATTDATEDDITLYDGEVSLSATNIETILSTTMGADGDQINAGEHTVLFRFDADGQVTDATTMYEHVPTIAIKDDWKYTHYMWLFGNTINIDFNVVNFVPGPSTNVSYSWTSLTPADYYDLTAEPRIRGPPLQPLGEIDSSGYAPYYAVHVVLRVTAYDNIRGFEDNRNFSFVVDPYRVTMDFTFSDSSTCSGFILDDMTNYVMNGLAGYLPIQPPYDYSQCGDFQLSPAELPTAISRLRNLSSMFSSDWSDTLERIAMSNNGTYTPVSIIPCLEASDSTSISGLEVHVCN